MYYLRTRPAVQAIQFTVDQTKVKEMRKQQTERSNERIIKQAIETNKESEFENGNEKQASNIIDEKKNITRAINIFNADLCTFHITMISFKIT